MSANTIPCLDFSQCDSLEFAEQLSEAFSNFGFVALENHGLSAALRERAFEVISKFFDLSRAEKLKYFVPDGAGARGYTEFGRELAKDSITPDLKEFYHVGRELPLDKRVAEKNNIWPQEIPEFRREILELFSQLDRIGARVLQAVARGLKLDPDYFVDKTNLGNSLIRALHYPPVPAGEGLAVRAGAHEDINLITLLIGTPQPGLEILCKDGEWIEAPRGSEYILCNVGDMLQRLSNHQLSSTTHRVVNPPAPYCEVSRYSLPFFLHPNSDFLIETLPSCITATRKNRYPNGITADAFLQERLGEIGLL